MSGADAERGRDAAWEAAPCRRSRSSTTIEIDIEACTPMFFRYSMWIGVSGSGF